MSKHTPGPWHVQSGNLHPMIVAHDGTYVARIHSHEWPRINGLNATAVANAIEEARANATLIATAPELLKQLKLVVEMWRNIYTAEYATDEEACISVKDAIAAIAKAEGRTE